MKSTFLIGIFFTILIFSVISCQRQPNASFTSLKDNYGEGDTIHFVNTSENGKSFLWTTPEGTTYASKDLDYPVKYRIKSGKRNFRLDVFSKNEKKTAFAIKPIGFYQSGVPTDYFTDTLDSYTPLQKMDYINGNNWVVEVINCFEFYIDCTLDKRTSLSIYFPGNAPLTTGGSFSLQKDSYNLPAGKASIRFIGEYSDSSGNVITYRYVKSTSGQVDVTVLPDGRLRCIYNNISAACTTSGYSYVDDVYSTWQISGEITY